MGNWLGIYLHLDSTCFQLKSGGLGSLGSLGDAMIAQEHGFGQIVADGIAGGVDTHGCICVLARPCRR